MTERSKSLLLPGTLELIVLQLLSAEPTNGYDLTLRIQAVSREVLNVNAGSLYPALYRLEEKRLIKASWEQTDAGRSAKVYAVTPAGRRQLAEQRDSWKRFVSALTAILKTT
jgi:PadR family transcriptional regulator, regulatory protein PadR